MNIALPDVDLYFNNANSTGPVPRPIDLVNGSSVVEYNCNSSASNTGSSGPPQSPYVALTATINGVDYPIDSTGNLLRPQSPASSAGFCPVGITNRSDTLQPNVVLGLPFLRSVYVCVSFSCRYGDSHAIVIHVIYVVRTDSRRTTVQGTMGSPFRRARIEHRNRSRKRRQRRRPTARSAWPSLHLPRRRRPTSC